jgi:hypothetical protein
MTKHRAIVIVCLWVLSLIVAAQWPSAAQEMPVGAEVRFLPSGGQPGMLEGTLVANIRGQWLPVAISHLRVPNGNGPSPR